MVLGTSSHYFIGSPQRIADFCKEGWKTYKADLDQADVVYTQKLKIYNFLLQCEDYKEKVRFVPLMNCAAFHPDMTYMRHNGTKLVGPMGDYHSILVTAAYFAGLSQNAAISLFRPDVYEAMGYFSKSQVEIESFEQRFRQNDIDVEDLIVSHKGAWMRTLNHPRSSMVVHLVSRILERDGIAIKNRSPSVCDWIEDNLAKGPEWPLYPGLLESVSMADGEGDDTTMIFKSPYKSNGKAIFLGLDRLVEYSYASLQGVEMTGVKMLNHDLNDAVETLKKIETV